MTPKEIAQEALANRSGLSDPVVQVLWVDSLSARIAEYANDKCQEQREICAKMITDDKVGITAGNMLLAPKPEGI